MICNIYESGNKFLLALKCCVETSLLVSNKFPCEKRFFVGGVFACNIYIYVMFVGG